MDLPGLSPDPSNFDGPALTEEGVQITLDKGQIGRGHWAR